MDKNYYSQRWINILVLFYAHLVAALGIMFNEEQPHAVKESGGSFNMNFTLIATTSHDVTIMITITGITTTGNYAVCSLNSILKLYL